MTSSKSVCDCPNPPGGQAVCEGHQIAICRIKDGKLRTECINPPQEVVAHAIESHDLRVLREWALSEVLGADRDQFEEPVLIAKGDRTLRFTHRRSGEQVNISMPALVTQDTIAAAYEQDNKYADR